MTGNGRYNKRRRKKQRQKDPLLFLLLLLTALVISALQEKEGGSRQEKVNEIMNASEELTNLEVHFIDVGQGDATLIRCEGQAMLIDAGDNSKGTAVQLYLKKCGVERLDYLIGTHPDADHIGGLDVIITKFDCEKIIMPKLTKDNATYRDVISAMKYKGYESTAPEVGRNYQLGSAEFTIIAPNKSYGEDYNNSSVGLLLVHGNNRFLFTGDAKEEAEADMLANGIDLKADVLKAGHHGSSSSCSAAFLDAVQPAYGVISCGEGNSYGHPHGETLNAFRKRGIQVFRTDEQGSVEVISDGDTLTWNCAPSETWKAGN